LSACFPALAVTQTERKSLASLAFAGTEKKERKVLPLVTKKQKSFF
jgi:hypothetical protein